MELTPIFKRVIGLDVHQAQITACAIMEQADGTVVIDERQFGGFKRDRQALTEWTRSIAPELVVMESTGIYWKSPFAALERVGIIATVVIRLGVVVSDLHGLSARLMVKALIAGKSVPEVLSLASNRLRASREEIFESLQAEDLTSAHCFVLTEVMAHIESLEERSLALMRSCCAACMRPTIAYLCNCCKPCPALT